MRVVNQRVVPITPWKKLVPKSKVGVGNELGLAVLLDVFHMGHLPGIRVVGHQTAGRQSHEESDVAPRYFRRPGVQFFL